MLSRNGAARRALLLISILAAGCISLAPRSLPAGPEATVVEGVPIANWGENRCAAGALSEVLTFLGDRVTEEELSRSLVTARHGGVVTVDVLLAARDRGFDARLARGDFALIQRELGAERPLILVLRVMDSPATRDDLFHYVVLSGVDPARRLIRMHYGDGRLRWASADQVEASWRAAGYCVVLIGPKTTATSSHDDLRRAVLLQDSGRLDEAIALYKDYLASHAESALAWTDLGNAYSASGERRLAEVAFRNAIFIEPDSCDALNNLAWLLLEDGRLDEAEKPARRALSSRCTDPDLVADTLRRIGDARRDASRFP